MCEMRELAEIPRILFTKGPRTAKEYQSIVSLPIQKSQLYNSLHSILVGATHANGVVSLRNQTNSKVWKKLKVLVAEDNVTNQEVIRMILERSGHDVTLVADGAQALNVLAMDVFDVCVVDMQMPHVGGST